MTQNVLYSTLGISFHFDAAHRLPNYKGDCSRMHGHTWKFEIRLNGRVDPKQGTLIDFKLVKNIVQTRVLNKLDHYILNDSIQNPTAENLAAWIHEELFCDFAYIHIELLSTRVWESPTAWAEFKPIGGWNGKVNKKSNC